MNSEFAPIYDELQRLVSAQCEGGLTAAMQQRLETLVLHEPLGLNCYLQYVADTASLRLWAAATEDKQATAQQLAVGPVTAPRAGEALPAADGPVATARPARSPVLGFLGAVWDHVQASPRTLVMVLGGALGIYFVTVFALIPLARLAGPARLGKIPSPGVGALKSDAEIGSLRSDERTRWSKGLPVRSEAKVRVGERYELVSGQAEVQLVQGVRITIEGPAAWLLESEKRLRFDSGKLLAHVPPAGIGFTVATPAGEVVDLGTEFGVVVAEGRTEVHVIQGKVEVKRSRARRAAAVGSIRLVAGNAVRMEDRGTGVSSIGLDRAGFRAMLQNSSDQAAVGHFSAAHSTDLSADSVTFQDGVAGYSGTQDTLIYGGSPDSNYGTRTTFDVYERETSLSNFVRGLIRFDLSSMAPGTIVTGATLTLHRTTAQGAQGVSNSLHVIATADKDWTETGATWNSAVGSTAWAGEPGLVAGTDYSETAVATAATPVIAATPTIVSAPMSFKLNAAGVAAIQHWVNNPADNSGFFIRQPDLSYSIDRFWSREAPEVTLRPALTLTVGAP